MPGWNSGHWMIAGMCSLLGFVFLFSLVPKPGGAPERQEVLWPKAAASVKTAEAEPVNTVEVLPPPVTPEEKKQWAAEAAETKRIDREVARPYAIAALRWAARMGGAVTVLVGEAGKTEAGSEQWTITMTAGALMVYDCRNELRKATPPTLWRTWHNDSIRLSEELAAEIEKLARDHTADQAHLKDVAAQLATQMTGLDKRLRETYPDALRKPFTDAELKTFAR